jgi:predicted alpha/beta-fold hydrolase
MAVLSSGGGAAAAGFPRFRARPPWWGGDLQTLRNYFRPAPVDLSGFQEERLEFPMNDGSGDTLLATLNRPAAAPADGARRPLAMLIHGLTGDEDSSYMLATAGHLLHLGHPVMRLNLRGAGPSRPRCRFQYHAGRSEDLRRVLMQLDGRLASQGILLVAYSLGANMLLKYLGEQGRRAPVLGAVSVSAPIDLKATQVRFMQRRNRAYHDFILGRMKAEIAAPNSTITPEQRAGLDVISTVYDFDDRLVAPVNEFSGADDYYARCSAQGFMKEIKVPTLVIHAHNDPWILPGAYLSFDWKANPKLTPLLPRGGGHVGFHGLGSRVPWHDRCIADFLRRLG